MGNIKKIQRLEDLKQDFSSLRMLHYKFIMRCFLGARFTTNFIFLF
jgi:hypothetical protein